MLAGPLDYHSGGFRSVRTADFTPRDVAPDVMGTRCQQLAMYVVYENPMPMAVDYPAAYRGQPGHRLSLRGADDLGRDAVNRRQGRPVHHRRAAQGRGWYVGSMTNGTPRELKVPLTFLGDGKFIAEVWADDAAAGPNGVAKRTADMTSNDELTQSLAPAGGQVVRIKRALSCAGE